jgi:hypothetical protein
MSRRAGSGDLPLHGGHVPRWLAERMTQLGAVMSEAIVHHYGRDELLRRLANPFWFQLFGAVMGHGLAFLWHYDKRYCVIRDKDPALKALLRHMERANSIATADTAIGQLLQALSSRGMLDLAGP